MGGDPSQQSVHCQLPTPSLVLMRLHCCKQLPSGTLSQLCPLGWCLQTCHCSNTNIASPLLSNCLTKQFLAEKTLLFHHWDQIFISDTFLQSLHFLARAAPLQTQGQSWPCWANSSDRNPHLSLLFFHPECWLRSDRAQTNGQKTNCEGYWRITFYSQ